jgi:putative transposase
LATAISEFGVQWQIFIYPEADEQRCWNNRIVNVLDKLAKKAQAEGKELLKVIPYAETEVAANVAKSRFQAWARSGGHNDAAALIDVDWERMVTFYRYPAQHWKHIRTSNIVESPFATLRLRTDAAKRYKKVENATGVIWKMLLVAEKSFRKLSAPALMRLLYAGAKYKNGLIVAEETKWSAA